MGDTATATWLTVYGGNDAFWRAEAPAVAVGGRVARIDENDVEATFMYPNTESEMPWRLLAESDGETHIIDSEEGWKKFNARPRELGELTAQFPSQHGPAVFTRPCLARATLGKAMRLEGIRTIAETDDNYFAPPRHNLFARTQLPTPRARDLIHDMHAKAMASMGVNVFSTVWLRDRYWKEYKRRFGLQGLPEMHVCRNSIDRAAWPTVPEYDGPVRVGFMGSPSHVWDVHLAYAAFHAAKYHGCHTTMIGYNPANPDPHIPDEITADGITYQLRTKKSLAVSRKWQAVIDEHIEWIAPEEYHRAHLPLDIGLAPLRDNDFTRGKSDVKAIEYSISGAACVLQRHIAYTQAGWKHEVNCLLAKSQEDMAIQTMRLIHDPMLRTELVANARKMIRTERNEIVMRNEWNVALAA